MLRVLKNKKAQAVMGEYVLLLFLVMTVVTVMTVYFKRAVQARMHDARNYMVNQVRERTDGIYNGELYNEYEPYYGNTTAEVRRDSEIETRIEGSFFGDIFNKFYNETSSVEVSSETAPPKEFNRTTPK